MCQPSHSHSGVCLFPDIAPLVSIVQSSGHGSRLTKYLKRKSVNIFLPISFNIFLGAQKNHFIEMVLLSTHDICLG